jgi:hypothetical protein
MVPVFLRDAATLLSEEELFELVTYLSLNPEAGVVIPATGGVRKLRWRLQGRGKRGGARVIYFYYNGTMPHYLFALYAKNAKDDLTEKEKAELRVVVQGIVESWKRKRKAG